MTEKSLEPLGTTGFGIAIDFITMWKDMKDLTYYGKSLPNKKNASWTPPILGPENEQVEGPTMVRRPPSLPRLASKLVIVAWLGGNLLESIDCYWIFFS
jgi:hypothetical protein